MFKIKIICILIIVLSFIGCSDDCSLNKEKIRQSTVYIVEEFEPLHLRVICIDGFEYTMTTYNDYPSIVQSFSGQNSPKQCRSKQ